ncbi:hypothetical protein [Shewanella zhangzhouensis]|uniref:hypothetical protein n=1 Tax=Shewanella zhangzhouensis TaxID=2864213 RepID=UPI001C65BA18|nr:hypothetical protein [Shewanella zhangzhouensis]QYK03526.1 hypothetical protein K0H63_10405 [Shewanella zhangzhouensis]
MTNSSNSNDSSRNPQLKTPGMQESSIQSGGHEACAEEDKSNGLGDSLAPAPQPIHAHRHDRLDDGSVALLSLFATRTPKDVPQLHLAAPVLPARDGDNIKLGIERTNHTSGSLMVPAFTAFMQLDGGARPETAEQEETVKQQETVKQEQTAQQDKTLERDRIDVRQTLPLKLLLPVTLVHLAVLGLLAWQLAPQLGSLSAALDERANQPKALQSYLVFSTPKQPIEQPPEANPSDPAAVKPQSEPEPEQVKREQVNEQNAPIEPALSTAPKEPAPIKDEPLPAQPAVESAQKARRESLPPIETPAPSEHSQLDFSTPASRFVARQNAQALNALSQSYADEQTVHMNAAGRGMSELLPEMEVLLVPSADDFYKPNTLDSDIDPNRIVKSGDTCYRVVKVPTPINPHAENLGFPFRCGEDRVKKALKEGINKYLALMGKQDLR